MGTQVKQRHVAMVAGCAIMQFMFAVILADTGTEPDCWEIASGVCMPTVNLGHPDDGGTELDSALKWLKLGGVGIDTALVYNNQDQVGAAVRQSKVPRDKIFITTKIPCPPDAKLPPWDPPPGEGRMSPEKALEAVREDLRQLDVEFVDLMLLHFPCKSGTSDTIEMWKGLQEALAQNLTRAIGVSNFNSSDLDAVISVGGAKPAVNQCQMSIGSHDDATIAYTKQLGIYYEAYSPLRRINLSTPLLVSIAKAHGKSPAQVALKWINQQGVIIATSPGVNEKYMLQAFDLDNFSLTSEEMISLSELGKNEMLNTAVMQEQNRRDYAQVA